MSVLHKTMYPHFRLKEVHVVQPDRLIHYMTFQLSTWGLGAALTVIGHHSVSCEMLYVRCPCHFLYCVCACVCAGLNMSVNHLKCVSPGEDPETRRMRTVKNIADLRQNLEETMSSLRGTQISHR